MDATYSALLKHGYAELSISKIGDEFDKSQSLLYYHYEGKDELLIDFLRFLVDNFREHISNRTGSPSQQLRSLLNTLLSADSNSEMDSFVRVYFELRSQAISNPMYRKQFTKIDKEVHSVIAELIEQGVDEGEFSEVDPDEEADRLLIMITGMMYTQATVDLDTVVAQLRQNILQNIGNTDDGDQGMTDVLLVDVYLALVVVCRA
jgi:AcrR family transcriptional regulator